MEYFSYLPIFTYNDQTCRDITRRVAFNSDVTKTPTMYYPYEVQAGMRPENLAYLYYEDPYLDWLIFHANGIIDPYYGWYLGEADFDAYLVKKYGSIEEAMRRVKHYTLNWSDDDIDISPSFYEDNLPEVLKKYYTPNFGFGTRIISYKRRKEDWITNTNKIVNFNVTLSGNTEFANAELVNVVSSGEAVGRAEIVVANSTVVTVQHVSGNTDATNLLVGLTSEANATITDTDLVQTVIDPDEFVYWTAVTQYDFEREKNEANKHIYLLDKSATLSVADTVRRKLKD